MPILQPETYVLRSYLIMEIRRLTVSYRLSREPSILTKVVFENSHDQKNFVHSVEFQAGSIHIPRRNLTVFDRTPCV